VLARPRRSTGYIDAGRRIREALAQQHSTVVDRCPILSRVPAPRNSHTRLPRMLMPTLSCPVSR
jgi:hypothetical protein